MSTSTSNWNLFERAFNFFDQYVSYVDAYRLPLRLNLKRRVFFQTGLGGFLTTITIAIVLYQLAIQLTAMTNRTSNTFTTKTFFSDDPGPLELNSSNFVFAMKIDQYTPLDQQIVKFTLELGSFIRNADGSLSRNYISIPLEICTKEYFQGFEESYTKYNLSTAYCPSLRSYPIAGSFIADNYTFIKLQVSKCTNSSTQVNKLNTTCLPSAEIESALSQGVRVELFFSNDVLDLDNFTHPSKRYLINEDWTLTPQAFRKSVDMYIQEQNIQSNTELITWRASKQMETKRAITYNQLLREQQLSLDGDKLLSVFLRKNYYSTLITRTYPQITNVLSSVGGLINALFAIFGIIVSLYTNYRYYKDIADGIYEFETKNSQGQTVESLSKVVNDGISQANLDLKVTKNSEQKVGIETILKYSEGFSKTLPSKKLRLTFLQFVRSFICPCKRQLREKRSLYLKARSKLLMDLDVIQIVKKLKEFDKLKAILLDENQMELLASTETPCVSLEGEGKGDGLDLLKNSDEQMSYFKTNPNALSILKFLKLLNAYRQVKYSESSESEKLLNEELIEKIDPNMRAALVALDRELNNPKSEIGAYLRNNFRIDDPPGSPIEILITNKHEDSPILDLENVLPELPTLKETRSASNTVKPSLFKRIDDIERDSPQSKFMRLYNATKFKNHVISVESMRDLPMSLTEKKDEKRSSEDLDTSLSKGIGLSEFKARSRARSKSTLLEHRLSAILENDSPATNLCVTKTVVGIEPLSPQIVVTTDTQQRVDEEDDDDSFFDMESKPRDYGKEKLKT